MPDLSQAQSIHISDNWGGLNSLAPEIAEYELANKGGDFVGQGTFSVGGENGGSDKPTTYATQVSIPAQQARAFLRLLQQVSLVKGTYQPSPAVDDYPLSEITVQLNNNKVVFHSEEGYGQDLATAPVYDAPFSGLSSHPSWKVTFDGEDYITTSPQPDEGLAKIYPYLHRDEMLHKLSVEHEQQR